MPGLECQQQDHAACSGCGLCLLACPVWYQTRDIRLTPHGRAKALQHGATTQQLAASIGVCTLCGACAPACPEGIDLVGMMLELRTLQPLAPARVAAQMRGRVAARAGIAPALLLPGGRLRSDAGRLARVLALLGKDVALAEDDGSDIALGVEAGVLPGEERIGDFLAALRGARRLIVAEGILHRMLRRRLPGVGVAGVGEALSALASVRAGLRANDFYVIEPRAFHEDYDRLIGYYDALREQRGCAMNLDLQRLAVPTTAGSAQHALGLPCVDPAEQVRWILQGRAIDRIVVEDLADAEVFARVSGRPVVHLGDVESVVT
jgi:ferredoxin